MKRLQPDHFFRAGTVVRAGTVALQRVAIAVAAASLCGGGCYGGSDAGAAAATANESGAAPTGRDPATSATSPTATGGTADPASTTEVDSTSPSSATASVDDAPSSTTTVGTETEGQGDSADSAGTAADADVDAFGITRLHPSAPGGPAWDSQHWENPDTTLPGCDVAPDGTRLLTDWDPCDPSGYSRRRGHDPLPINADGELVFVGNQPRLYIYDEQWTDVEFTTYYRRVTDDGTPWGGAVLGVRSGADGHTDSDNCDAHTYYGRFRHDGKVDFAKELAHPTSQEREATEIWGGDDLPSDQWIGVKFIAYNIDEGAHARLELWRDLTEGQDGGDWQLVLETEDDGGWMPANNCGYGADYVPTGPGVLMIRNTGIVDGGSLGEARYKWTSVREITPEL